ncbi:hypothetical protein [Streptomyces sp. NPDC088847]|uniref:hypothetical protein n=1 Tax=Streptomyces sp. NPDC088847 TaxID=3365909 RepID=UPI00381E4E7F
MFTKRTSERQSEPPKMPPALGVLITPDGIPLLAGRPVNVGDDETVPAAVLNAVQRQAQSRQRPVRVTILDQQGGYTAQIEVAPDGSSQLLSETYLDPVTSTPQQTGQTAGFGPALEMAPPPMPEYQPVHQQQALRPTQSYQPQLHDRSKGPEQPQELERPGNPEPSEALTEPVFTPDVSVFPPASRRPEHTMRLRRTPASWEVHTPDRDFRPVLPDVQTEHVRIAQTQPAAVPAVPTQDSLPPAVPEVLWPFLKSINDAITAGSLAHAEELTAHLYEKVRKQHGAEHSYALEVLGMAAYVAFLKGDHESATALLLDLARMRKNQHDTRAREEVKRAVVPWMLLDDKNTAIRYGQHLSEIWSELSEDHEFSAADRDLLTRVQQHLGRALQA